METLAPGTFFEVAINLSRLADPDTGPAVFDSLQIASPADFAVAGFGHRPSDR